MTAADLVITSGILVHYDVRQYFFTVRAWSPALITDHLTSQTDGVAE